MSAIIVTKMIVYKNIGPFTTPNKILMSQYLLQNTNESSLYGNKINISTPSAHREADCIFSGAFHLIMDLN